MEKFNRQAREYFGRDDYALAMTITAPSIKQEILTEILSKFVRSKLNKYLIGTNWRKKSQAELFQIVVFPEGVNLTKESHRGFCKGSFLCSSRVENKIYRLPKTLSLLDKSTERSEEQLSLFAEFEARHTDADRAHCKQNLS